VGIDDDKDKRPEERDLLGVWSRAIVAVVFTTLYIVTFGPRTGWAGGIVSGLLGGVVVFLLLREMNDRAKRRRR
jgi:uncharacterized membrane protein YdjX (TVP38/TMEM64 family)